MTPQSRTDPLLFLHLTLVTQQPHQINMPQDLRRTLAKNQIERGKAPLSKWQAAGVYNASLPPIRSPILIGGDSIIQTPEDLRDLLRLEFVPPSIETIETNLWPNKKPVSVCDVPVDQWLDIQDVTEGEMPVVWFQGK